MAKRKLKQPSSEQIKELETAILFKLADLEKRIAEIEKRFFKPLNLDESLGHTK